MNRARQSFRAELKTVTRVEAEVRVGVGVGGENQSAINWKLLRDEGCSPRENGKHL
jgi:hypothetical protein